MEKRGWGLLVVFFISCFVTIFFIANILGAPLDNCLNNVSSCTFCSWSMAKCSGGSCPTTGHPITQITNAQIYNYHSEMFRVFNLPPDTCNFQQSSCGSGNLECSAPGINICKNASWSSESTININNASDPMFVCLQEIIPPPSSDVVCAFTNSTNVQKIIDYGWWIRGDTTLPIENNTHSLQNGCNDSHDNDCNGYCDAAGCCAGIPYSTISSFNLRTKASCETYGNGAFWKLADPTCGCPDGDGDGFGAVLSSFCANKTYTDCNDNNPNVHPGATENCSNGIDDNCNGLIDCADPQCTGNPSCTNCKDNDGDHFNVTGGAWCGSIDCNDSNPSAYPGATEICNDGIKNNCSSNDCEYDSSVCQHGSSECKVDFWSIAIEGGTHSFKVGQDFYIDCITQQDSQVNSLYASVDGSSCLFNEYFGGGVTQFICNSGPNTGLNKTVSCNVNLSRSYSDFPFNYRSTQISVCTSNCTNRVCGSDGCGGSCGTCTSDKDCVEFQDSSMCIDNSACRVAFASWSQDEATENQHVFLIIVGNSKCSGQKVSFNVWENRLLNNQDAQIQPNNVTFNSSGYAIGNWTAELRNGVIPSHYQFKATVPQSVLEINSGTGTESIQVLKVNAPYNCTPVITCDDYKTKNACEANGGIGICGQDVVNRSADGEYNQQCGFDNCNNNLWLDNCGCTWDSGECRFYTQEKTCSGSNANFSTGWCKKGQTSVKDCNTPPEGIYISSWSGVLIWSQAGWNNQAECVAAMNADLTPQYCTNDSLASKINGKWYYYPRAGGVASCEQGGSSTINCPAEMNLPFFGTYNFIVTLIAISLIYLFLIKKRK